MRICKVHKTEAKKSTGWYGEKWECQQCLLDGVPQQIEEVETLEINITEKIELDDKMV